MRFPRPVLASARGSPPTRIRGQSRVAQPASRSVAVLEGEIEQETAPIREELSAIGDGRRPGERFGTLEGEG
ncbi:hypothetical protein GCM10009854_09040 [Saccharopolyspora halophila]|uniref:Uncharacterized protein n=1 Tax=Saccharopolyspora halophila TaxID=405551 RepID=A0ABN3FQG3_9PSEU